MLAAVLLISLQVWWKASLLGHSFFRVDDFSIIERAASHGLSGQYLMWVNAGHLIPLGLAVAWFLVKLSPYDWALVSAVTLVLLAATCLALLRMLRALFGDHPGILIPLLVYLVSPLSFAGLSWWTVTLEQLPLQLATFCAVTAHVHYLKTRRFGHAVAAAGWLLVAMASSEKGVVVPLLLLALTSAFFTSGRWSRGLVTALRDHWRAWLAYAVLAAGYAAVYIVQVRTSSVRPGRPGTASNVFAMAGDLTRDTFVPGAFGGPWKWFGSAGNALVNPPAGLLQVSWALAAAVIIVSLWYRPHSWRAWLILALWLIAADIVPVALGQRASFLPGAVSGHETRYVWDALGVLAICLSLAFLPLSGSIWSFRAFETNTTSASGRSYLATARLALADAPAGSVIVTDPVPQDVFGGLFLGPQSQVSAVLAPLINSRPGELDFINQPHGTFDHLLEFDGWGRLVPTMIAGVVNQPLPSGLSCWPIHHHSISVPLKSLAIGHLLRIGYLSGGSGDVTIQFAGQSQPYHSQQGLHSGYLPVHGSGNVIMIRLVRGVMPCIGGAEVGALLPSFLGAGIPQYAVPG